MIGSTRASSSNPAKVNNTPQPIKQSIQNLPKLDLQYDIIEDSKKLRVNISMYDLLQIYSMPNGPIITLAMSSVIPNNQNNAAANNNSNNDSIPTGKGKAIANKTSLIGKNSKSTTPPFLLTFEIFNRKNS